ncbi:MAG TPA: PfkB family carbohydrate kinase [Candidatus Baltobacteraceae bacterium]|jgi:D-beta-D-heptose 7-phosphate kinase/D-beta-D-heptose 1-phosphate adenosyltransferase|nr:PfkB family carbohydrate kinase [Candidatus Baltobacteraceae bacterium]
MVAVAVTHDVRKLLERMKNLRVLVVGDVMLDEWVWGTVTRISPEAPVPVVAVTDHSYTLGGAGNVANNLRALGAQVGIIGVVGTDAESERMFGFLNDLNVDRTGLLRVKDRPTTRKTRIVAHNQQVVRADWEVVAPLQAKDRAQLCDRIASVIGSYDAIVLSDYAKGLFSADDAGRSSLVSATRGARVVTADFKPANVGLFTGVTCVAPNTHEVELSTGISIRDADSMERACSALLERLACRYVVVTRGERGMALFGSEGERLVIPSVARTVYDVSGAGDTATAVLALALGADAPIEDALQMANLASGAVVEKLGTATASPAEIIALVEHG